jgi:uncharacterized protein YdhG (YjbR/CyaY superfamily)
MAKTDFKSVDEYIATFPVETQKALMQLRSTIRAAIPETEEVISYQIPCYKLNGGYVIYFAGFAKHCTITFPPPFTVFETLSKELARYKQSKSAVQFPLAEGMPLALVSKMAKLRLAQVKAEQAARVPAAKVPAAKAPAAKKPAAKRA